MLHKHITSLPHHPKRVIIISLILAAAIGTFGYIKINKKAPMPIVDNPSESDTIGASPSQNLTLGFLSGGRIKSVSVKAGDPVKKGQVLATLDAGNAAGALVQARAAYTLAQANYQKIINGATGTAVDVARSAVHTAQINLDGVTTQQNVLVTNAKINLLNSGLVAVNDSDTSLAAPTITGVYAKDMEGMISFSVHQTGNGGYVAFEGLANGTTPISTTAPQVLGDTGLYIQFPSISPYGNTNWNIIIPNKNAANYLSNYNAYQVALESKNQNIANAQATLDQANASLKALVSAARPEDVSVAEAQVNNALGALQIAQAAVQNTIIAAPADGTIVSVIITPGQIAVPNAPAIEFISN